jgi:signal transduction histidine kinase
VGEETAVAAMRAGAHDFMPKGALVRLIAVIERELREASNRTEHRKMHEKLLISERMASVGTVTAGVAHEINNPLTVLLANLDIVADTLAGVDVRADAQSATAATTGNRDGLAARLAKVSEPLRDAQVAAERVRLIVRDLNLFSRAGDEERRGSVDVHAVLETSLRMTANEVRHRARLTKEFGDIPQVEGNEARLGQVFLNLLVNAAQAIPEGHADANEIKVVTRMEGANSVAVEIHDTGNGITADVLPRIFDPFFTTKPVGIGTGLGLAICHRIIGALGGQISVESQVGKGTVFRIVLPRAVSIAAVAGPAPVVAVGGRRGRVLVVDDEPMLCATIQRMLERDHDVTATTTAKKALHLISGGERFDIILCDLMMPRMTGMDLHAELLALAPDQAQKLVFMTGGVFTQNARAYLDKVSNLSIEKPFRATLIQSVVQKLLQ